MSNIDDNEEELFGVRDISYGKSNLLINAKYESTLLEDKLFSIALSDQSRMVNDHGTIRVKIPASELRVSLKGNAGSFYETLNKVASRMGKRQLGFEKDGKFAYFQVIQTAVYDKSYLHITFNSDLSKYLHDLQGNFTLLSLPIMLQFNNDYAFRLYEILKSRAFNHKNENKDKWQIEFEVAELFLLIGIVNPEDKKVKDILVSAHPDFEKAVEVADDKKKSLLQWNSFKTRVLDKAIPEINEKSDINVTYQVEKRGRGGKVKKIIFVVKPQELSEVVDKPVKELTEDEKLQFLDDLQDSFEGKWRTLELKKIAEAGHYDYDYIMEKYDLMISQRAEIENKVGWLLEALEKDYHASEGVSPARSTAKKPDHENREYDFDELEEELSKKSE